jgi:hypothetical protein
MIENKESTAKWNKTEVDVFWAEIAPSNHLLQIYENDEDLMASLEGFVSTGLKNQEAVIIIATTVHLKALNRRLLLHGFDLTDLQKQGCYIPLNAEDVLQKFMVKDWPDEKLFSSVVESILATARGTTQRRVRAYGEMVALLWAQGFSGATVQLEHLWNQFCEGKDFGLFCAYPASGFTAEVHESIGHICSAHTQIIKGHDAKGLTLLYRNT